MISTVVRPLTKCHVFSDHCNCIFFLLLSLPTSFLPFFSPPSHVPLLFSLSVSPCFLFFIQLLNIRSFLLHLLLLLLLLLPLLVLPRIPYSLPLSHSLTNTDRPGLNRSHISQIKTMNQAVLRGLQSELNRTHKMPSKGDVTVIDQLMCKITELKDLSKMHMDALISFRKTNSTIDFPALHKELFSVDAL